MSVVSPALSLVTHLQTHSDTKPYSCGKSFRGNILKEFILMGNDLNVVKCLLKFSKRFVITIDDYRKLGSLVRDGGSDPASVTDVDYLHNSLILLLSFRSGVFPSESGSRAEVVP